MKKAVIAACLAVSATLAMASCSNTTQPSDNYELAGGVNVDYTFEYPKTWEKTRDDGMIAVKSTETGANISVTAFRPTENYASIEEYLEKYKSSFAETLGNYSEISLEDVTLDDISAKKITYTATVMDAEYKFASIVCIRNNIVYTITYTATDADFDVHAPTLAHIIQSFDFQ